MGPFAGRYKDISGQGPWSTSASAPKRVGPYLSEDYATDFIPAVESQVNLPLNMDQGPALSTEAYS